MAVVQSGTPATPATTVAGTGTVVVTGAWGTGQNRAGGNLLVALVTAFGSTSAGATAQNTGTTGWTKVFESSNALCRAAIWTCPAVGADAAPAFTSSISGTSARTQLSCALIELTDNVNPGTTPVLNTGNSGTTTAGTLTVTTAAAVAVTGEYAVGVECATSGASAANTWTTSGSWTQSFTDGTTSFGHFVDAVQASPPAASLAYAPTHSITSTQVGGAVAVFRAGEVSPGLEVYGFSIPSPPLSNATINSVTVAVTEHQSNAAQQPCSIELWDYTHQTPALDSVGPSSAGAGNTTTATLSWTHTAVASGVHLLAGVATDKSPDTGLVTAVTCDGTAMTQVGPLQHTGGAQTVGYLTVWQATGLASGAHTIAVTVTGGTPNRITGGSLAFTNGGGLGTIYTATGNSTTPSVSDAVNTSGNLIAAFLAFGSTINTATSPLTIRYNKDQSVGGAGAGSAAGATAPATGSSVTCAWAGSATDFWATIAVEVMAAARIGTAQTGTASISTANVSSATFTGVSYAQLANLRVRVLGRAPVGSGYIESVDAVSLVVNYTGAAVGQPAEILTSPPSAAARFRSLW